jgi:hypothetical protein
MHQEMMCCGTAFNDSEERSFGECLEPKIALFTHDLSLNGHAAVLQYFSEYYFIRNPPRL